MQLIELRQIPRHEIKDSKLAKIYDEVNLNKGEDFINNSIINFSKAIKNKGK